MEIKAFTFVVGNVACCYGDYLEDIVYGHTFQSSLAHVPDEQCKKYDCRNGANNIIPLQ